MREREREKATRRSTRNVDDGDDDAAAGVRGARRPLAWAAERAAVRIKEKGGGCVAAGAVLANHVAAIGHSRGSLFTAAAGAGATHHFRSPWALALVRQWTLALCAADGARSHGSSGSNKGRVIAGGRKKDFAMMGVSARVVVLMQETRRKRTRRSTTALSFFLRRSPPHGPMTHTHTRPWPDLNCWGVPWFLALTAGATGSCARRPESAAANGAGMQLFYATVAGAVRRFMQSAGPWSSRCFIKMR